MNSSVRLDRLSALLDGLAPRITVRHAGSALAATSFAREAPATLRLHLVTSGQIWLKPARGARQCLSAPAIAVLRSDCAHALIARNDGAPAAGLMCFDVRFGGPASTLLLDAFAQPLLLPLDEADPQLGMVLRLIAFEVAQPRCGQPTLLTRAADILFIGLLRHLLAHPRTTVGLLNGLADARIARALVALHTAPQRPWTLDTLAQEAGMSRTAFAVRFREAMNSTPGSYLGQLRLAIARRAVESGLGLKRAARESGYASTTALSRALARQSTPA